MRELQERISDIKHWKNDPYEVIRHFKECNGDLDKVEDTFRAMIQWRQENDMETFLLRYGSPHPLFHFLPVSVLHGTDKEGDPIYLVRVGACDFYPFVKYFGSDAIVDYIIFIREMTNHPQFWKRYEKENGRRVRNYTVLFDLEGLSMRHLKSCIRSTMKQTSQISQKYYAGWCKRILYIRAPSISMYVWRFAAPFFNPQLQEIMQLAGSHDYLTLLDKYIDRKILPVEICPNEGKGRPMPGYFENVKLHGGPLPSSLFKQQLATKPGCDATTE